MTEPTISADRLTLMRLMLHRHTDKGRTQRHTLMASNGVTFCRCTEKETRSD